MSTKTFIPDSYKTTFIFDIEKKTYAQFRESDTSAKKLLPSLIRLERNNGYNSITGANLLLRIRNANNWSKCTITGLRSTDNEMFFYSDLPINGKKSLCVVKYPPDGQTIEIRVCRQFYPMNPTDRARLVKHLVQNF